MSKVFVLFSFIFLGLFNLISSLKVGAGMADMTGPAVEINFMGYALPRQRGTGILQRLRARAFVFEEDATDGKEPKRVVYVSCDGGMGSDLVNMRVIDRLDEVLGKGVYTIENIAVSGTHTHAGPGGFHQYALFQMTSLGFVQETFDAWVTGVSNAIIRAHKNLKDADVLVNSGTLTGSNINRSPTSYYLNPQEEIDQYPDGETDKRMLLLNFINKKTNKEFGSLNWFAVHGTALNNTNTLVSGDNKGFASYALERYMNGPQVETGKGDYIAGFSSTNLGDVSPNIMGPKCIDTGLPCDGATSSCNGKCQNCIASGPGSTMYESNKIIGQKQYEFARDLIKSATEKLTNSIKTKDVVDYRHSFVDTRSLEIKIPKNKYDKTATSSELITVKLCNPAMGYSFAAGTTDGPGAFNFTQGTTTENPFWNRVRDFLSKPTPEEEACQAPKPILLNTGDIALPYEWDPKIIPMQIFRINNFFILNVPSEFTTMSGRRLRNAVEKIIVDSKILGDKKPYITIGGLANSYHSYVTTWEEYQAQRYEAASTIYGPYTLDAYIQEFERLTRDLVSGTPSTSTVTPPDLSDVLFELMPSPKFDRVPIGSKFGDIIEDVSKNIFYPAETVVAKFHGANPRNNQKLESNFLTVELKSEVSINNSKKYVWKTVANDGDYNTVFHWAAGLDDPLDFGVSARSISTLSWEIPSDAAAGTYRICYHGDAKKGKLAKIIPFTGCSSEFTVQNSSFRGSSKNRRVSSPHSY